MSDRAERYHVAVVPIRVTVDPAPPDTHRTLRGVGFRFECSCGVKGPRCETHALAYIGLGEHVVTHTA